MSARWRRRRSGPSSRTRRTPPTCARRARTPPAVPSTRCRTTRARCRIRCSRRTSGCPCRGTATAPAVRARHRAGAVVAAGRVAAEGEDARHLVLYGRPNDAGSTSTSVRGTNGVVASVPAAVVGAAGVLSGARGTPVDPTAPEPSAVSVPTGPGEMLEALSPVKNSSCTAPANRPTTATAPTNAAPRRRSSHAAGPRSRLPFTRSTLVGAARWKVMMPDGPQVWHRGDPSRAAPARSVRPRRAGSSATISPRVAEAAAASVSTRSRSSAACGRCRQLPGPRAIGATTNSSRWMGVVAACTSMGAAAAARSARNPAAAARGGAFDRDDGGARTSSSSRRPPSRRRRGVHHGPVERDTDDAERLLRRRGARR